MRSSSSTVSVRPDKHGERVVEAAEIEFGDDGVVALLDQEAPAFRSELLLDQAELGVGEVEAVDVVRSRCPAGSAGRSGSGTARRWCARSARPARRAGDCVPNTMKPFCLRMVFSLFLARSRKASSPSAFQNSSMSMIRRRPSIRALHAMEQVHHQRCADVRVVQQVGHVEADERGRRGRGRRGRRRAPSRAAPPRHQRSSRAPMPSRRAGREKRAARRTSAPPAGR